MSDAGQTYFIWSGFNIKFSHNFVILQVENLNSCVGRKYMLEPKIKSIKNRQY